MRVPSWTNVGAKSVFCFFALVFLASNGGHTDHWDGKIYYMISESIVQNGSLELRRDLPSADLLEFDVDLIIALQHQHQNPGEEVCLAGWDFDAGTCHPHELQDDWADPDLPDAIYTTAPPLLPLLGAPLYAAERLVGMPGQLAPFLLNPLILAGTAAVLFRLSYEIFRSRAKAFVLALAFGVCSFAWPYGDTFLLQPIAGLLLVLAVYLAYTSSGRGGILLPALAGAAAVGVIFGHSASVIFVPGLVAFFALSNRDWKKLGAFFSGLAAVAAAQLWLNQFRFGDMLDFGYGHHAGLETHAYTDGLLGLIFSPGFGLLANMPLLILAPAGAYLLWKKHRALAALVGYVFAVSLVYFGTLESPVWHGFGGWGPRYLVPIIPILVLPLGFFLDRAAGMFAKASFAALAAAGFFVNLMGTLVWYQIGYTYGWNSLRADGVPLEMQMGLFQWTPQYAPAVLHWNVLTLGYWDLIQPAPGQAYWPACVPDVLLHCSFGLWIVPALAAVAAAGFWISTTLWAGSPVRALAAARSRLLGRRAYAAAVLVQSRRARTGAGFGKQYLDAGSGPAVDEFYSPVPDPSKIPREFFDSETATIDWNVEVQKETLGQLAQFGAEYEPIKKNDMFGWHDAPVYYAMVRRFRPSKIIEIGGGHSTKVSAAACRDNGSGSITVVDPFIDDSFQRELPGVEIIKKPVQEMGTEFFEGLRENDVLFIDSTHICKTYSDVNYLILEVLPRLGPGVLVHFHDIQLPKPYPLEWMEKYKLFFNEQYVLQAFLYKNSDFEIVAALKYMGAKHPDLLRAVHDSEPPGGGSFWIRKVQGEAPRSGKDLL